MIRAKTAAYDVRTVILGNFFDLDREDRAKTCFFSWAFERSNDPALF